MSKVVTSSDVLSFWFGRLRTRRFWPDRKSRKWFVPDAKFDAEVRSRFEQCHRLLSHSSDALWSDHSRDILAKILVLDQFSRNLYRDDARSFAQDSVAQALCLSGLDNGEIFTLWPVEQAFFIMPLMHAESLPLQDRCVREFTRLTGTVAEELVPKFNNFLEFAKKHRRVIIKFGRFPHRNEVLKRQTTLAERRFLDTEGQGF